MVNKTTPGKRLSRDPRSAARGKAPNSGIKQSVILTPAMAKELGIKPKRKATGRPFQKGKAKTGGRQKGTPNKFTGTMKQAVMEAFQALGGPAFFVALGKSKIPANKRAVAQLFGKMIPMQVSGENGGAIVLQFGEEYKDA